MPDVTYSSPPGQTTSVSFDVGVAGLGMTAGFQVIKAATGTVAIGRTTVGVLEMPAGSGVYRATFTAPVEPDIYVVVLDWHFGQLEPETSAVVDLIVAVTAVSDAAGMTSVADFARMALGGEVWNGLSESPNFGSARLQLAIDVIKSRVMTDPPSDDSGLPKLVLSYLGKLTALSLIPAARDWWSAQAISQAIGDEPTEVVTYASRDRALDAVEAALERQTAAEAAVAIALIDGARLPTTDTGPAIDETDDMHYVTEDPRFFPSIGEFPYHTHVPNRARENTVLR